MPTISFVWSKDFSYANYLEQKSHFDSVELSVDRATEAVLGSSSEIKKSINAMSGNLSDAIQDGATRVADAVATGFNQIDQTLSDGFANISLSLQDISGQLTLLTEVIDYGLAELIDAQNRTNALLEDLVTIAKHPEASRARERFEYAKSAFARGLYDDALEYIDQAIEGDQHASGFRLEAAFHYLRGEIYLSSHDLVGTDFLSKAEMSFGDAAKYAAGENRTIHAMAEQMLSWTLYCQGKFEEALAAAKRSFGLESNNAVTNFYLAKYQARLKKNGEIIQIAFKRAIRINPFLIVRIQNDADFENSGFDIERAARSAIADRRNELRSRISSSALPNILQLIKEAEANGISCNRLAEEIEALHTFNSELTLLDGRRKKEILLNIKEAVEGLLVELEAKRARLEGQINEAGTEELKTAPFHDGSENRVIGVSIVVTFLIVFFGWLYQPSSAYSGIGDHEMFTIFFVVVSGLIALVVGGIVGFILAAILKRAHDVNRKTQTEALNRSNEEQKRRMKGNLEPKLDLIGSLTKELRKFDVNIAMFW